MFSFSTGYVAGARYDNTGSGSDFICLPDEPTLVGGGEASSNSAKVHGTWYKTGTQTNKEVPCAVCQSRRKNVLMIPGRNVCYLGYSVEYTGNLMSSRYTYQKATLICVDEDTEPGPILYSGSNVVALLYRAEASCGPIPCSTYPEGSDLPCAVCSQDKTT